MEKIGCIGPLRDHYHDAISNDMHVKSCLFSVSVSSISEFLMGVAYWVEDIVTDLKENFCQLLFRDLMVVYVTMCDKLKVIFVHWDSYNEAMQTELPPVLTHGLVKLCPSEFLRKVRDQRNHLDHLFLLPAHINVLGDEHKELLTEYHIESTTWKFIEPCDWTNSFSKTWRLIERHFPYLVKYIGGVVTILPGTSTAESDFSILRWEKNQFCKCLSDFALGKFMQANKYDHIEATVGVE